MRSFSVVAGLATGGLLLSCTNPDDPLAPNSLSDSSTVPNIAVQAEPDDPNALMRTVPGFGGFFFDSEGRPTVYLKSVAQRGEAERRLAPFLGSQRLTVSSLRVLPARYDWDQLERWFTQASTSVLGVSGTVFVDADESSNRVVLGVERGSGARIRGALTRLGVPDAAIIVRETEPIRFAATLRGRVRPAVGGLQINFSDSFSDILCTLGFNAIRNGQRSFITNSHCTLRRGGTEGTRYWQPTQTRVPTVIATEASDPLYFRNTNGCPPGFRCRFSDAARAAYASGTTVTLGRIAKTTGVNNGSVTISGSFTITREASASVGQTVGKVGRTSGWTQGRLTRRCVNIHVEGTDIGLICQNLVSARARPGDSGSPVFLGNTTIALVGVLWGGDSEVFAYSPISNIERELGALTTF
jgi:hypothetical protein